MLEIKDLCVSVLDKELLKDINLTINEGEVHVLMGPNGAGKSTLCKALLSYPSLKKEGEVIFLGKDIVHLDTSSIARLGMYYVMQSPIEIEGVKNAELIRSALDERNEGIDIFKFTKLSNSYCEALDIPKNFIHREVNVAMSGGEKKKNELLSMLFLKPKLIILDEIDSGLDVDAIKVVAACLNDYMQNNSCAILLVSHQKMLLSLLNVTHVHILGDHTIKKSGDASLINEVLATGFRNL